MNMSYCVFRNTLADLRDAKQRLEEICDFDVIDNTEERDAAKKLVALCKQIAEDWT